MSNYILSESDINPPSGIITYAIDVKNLKIIGNEISGELISVPYLNLTDKVVVIAEIEKTKKVILIKIAVKTKS